jgi:hypothetical protein
VRLNFVRGIYEHLFFYVENAATDLFHESVQCLPGNPYATSFQLSLRKWLLKSGQQGMLRHLLKRCQLSNKALPSFLASKRVFLILTVASAESAQGLVSDARGCGL